MNVNYHLCFTKDFLNYSSRHPIECHDEKCQICKFVESVAVSPVVNLVTVSDILSGNSSMPFLNKVALRSAQHDCADLRHAYAHLATRNTSIP